MQKRLFVNLPVRDIAAATRFYQAIGCMKNERFSDHRTANMAWSDAIFFHLMTHEYFATFTPRPVAEARKATEVLLALSFDSRAEVDAIAQAAGANGGKADPRPPNDMGWMYGRAFEDVDGHVFEAVWVDVAAIDGTPPA